MKTKIITLIGSFCLFVLNIVLAGEIAGFVVQVDPSTMKVGEYANLTIKAIDENGDVVDDYQGDIIITVTDKDGNELDNNDYTAPNDGTYSFTEKDQGIVTFSKGLVINKSGDFKVRVEDFETEKSGETEIKVISSQAEKEKGKIDISSPKEGETIIGNTLTIIAKAEKYKNAKYQIFIDNKLKIEGLVDNNGIIQNEILLDKIKNGNHGLQIKILDIDNKVIAESKKVEFIIKKDNKYFKGVEILPSEQVSQGTDITFNAKVNEEVSSVILQISNYGEFPMERKSIDTFTTTVKATKPGKFDISIKVKGDFGEKVYPNVDKIVIIEKIAITDVKFQRDNNEKKISLNWKFTGQIPMFKIEYGTGKTNLLNQVLVSENKYEIKNIDENLTYYIKIIPTDSNGNKIGDESKIIVIEPNMKKAASCMIDNIKLKTKIVGKKHLLVWNKIEGAEKYIIYKGDSTDNMKEVISTTGTSYEVPFDYNAKKDKYAYFIVKAKCDGELKQIDKAKKVKVGPIDWLIIAIILSFIIYGTKLAYYKE